MLPYRTLFGSRNSKRNEGQSVELREAASMGKGHQGARLPCFRPAAQWGGVAVLNLPNPPLSLGSHPPDTLRMCGETIPAKCCQPKDCMRKSAIKIK